MHIVFFTTDVLERIDDDFPRKVSSRGEAAVYRVRDCHNYLGRTITSYCDNVASEMYLTVAGL